MCGTIWLLLRLTVSWAKRNKQPGEKKMDFLLHKAVIHRDLVERFKKPVSGLLSFDVIHNIIHKRCQKTAFEVWIFGSWSEITVSSQPIHLNVYQVYLKINNKNRCMNCSFEISKLEDVCSYLLRKLLGYNYNSIIQKCSEKSFSGTK